MTAVPVADNDEFVVAASAVLSPVGAEIAAGIVSIDDFYLGLPRRTFAAATASDIQGLRGLVRVDAIAIRTGLGADAIEADVIARAITIETPQLWAVRVAEAARGRRTMLAFSMGYDRIASGEPVASVLEDVLGAAA